MTATVEPRTSERLSRFVDRALLSPNQAKDVIQTEKQPKQSSNGPTHAHGDFGHGDFGHADR